MRLIHDLLNIIYPNLCNICGEALTRNEELICFRCRSDLPKIKNIDIYENELTDRFLGKFDIMLVYRICIFINRVLLKNYCIN